MKKILFITGTRADYGKIKSLIKAVESSENFEAHVYISGMHLLEQYGSTYNEVLKDGYANVYVAYGQHYSNNMSYNLGDIICNLTGYVNHINPDMILIHGDRMDALAGAIVGAFNNILVGHIEGGEVSGTIDDSTRHAISKFSHLHFVSNEEAKKRLLQLGESESHIYVIGSPDIDLMMSPDLPSIAEALSYYDIPFHKYGILMYHPVTTEYSTVNEHIKEIIDAVIASHKNFVVIYPNNDLGTEIILNEYKRLEGFSNFKIFPSIRFELFLTLLKHADFMIGNSSAGIRETGIYGVPSIDVGTRQHNRYRLSQHNNIQWVSERSNDILTALSCVDRFKVISSKFGSGNSTSSFMSIITKEDIWSLNLQKQFVDLTSFQE